MDPQLIGKILRFSDPNTVGAINSEQPLLDPASCRALASGLVRLLRVSSTAGAARARNALLRNIRSLTTHTHSHHQATILPMLDEQYAKLASKPYDHSCDAALRDLSSFLASQMHYIDLEPKVDKTKLCLARAMLNVSPENPYIKQIINHLLNVADSDLSVRKFLLDVWAKGIFLGCENLAERLTVKAKPEIESILLDASYSIMIGSNSCVSEVLQSTPVRNLQENSSKSRSCFQLCCEIINQLFIYSNYNHKLLVFAEMFVQSIRSIAKNNYINLYDDELQSLVILMSCKEVLDEPNDLLDSSVALLKELKSKSIEKCVMLMTHFPGWVDVMLQQNTLI